MSLEIIIGIGSLVIAAAGLGFTIYKSKKAEKPGRGLLKRYYNALRKELGRIGVVGPGFETVKTPIRDTFTSLRISESGQREPDPGRLRRLKKGRFEEEMFLSPEKVMTRAFPDYRLLLIIGDPGSGKTTLLKHYAITCLDKEQDRLGFGLKKIIPLFFPLRELKFNGSEPLSLQENLFAWAKKNHLDISQQNFYYWLKNRRTLVLLDGLDEIGDSGKRAAVCDWVKAASNGLEKACFVLTSRPTGFRKSEGIELECEHLRGDIMDFNAQQQETFLYRWFRSVYAAEQHEQTGRKESRGVEKEAEEQAAAIIEFLQRDENKIVRELARVPMLLQVMAIIWKDRDFLPGSRSQLYDVSLDYLLAHRDRRRKLDLLLPAEKARLVLMPAALWMQETLKSDNAGQEEIHEFMQPTLDTLQGQPGAEEFCHSLRDRAGLIADYGEAGYIFRHKSFMEYLAGLQLVKECLADAARTADLIAYFPDPWWAETLRFFFSGADDSIFDEFMRRFFASPLSEDLGANQKTLLENLVREAPQKRIDSLKQRLLEKDAHTGQVRCILDCLKTVGTPEAVEAIQKFVQQGEPGKSNWKYAEDIAVELAAERAPVVEETAIEAQIKETPGSFRNPFEDNVEYILIPGGQYKYSVSEKLEKVPDLYFCKYPVTNKRYRRFIAYLDGEKKDLEEILSPRLFAEKLLDFSQSVKKYRDYLGPDPAKWQEELRSNYDEDKRFKGDDQPVVGVTWYAARAYCFWLSCLTAAARGDQKLQDLANIAGLFRLPDEVEWEWTAAGREPGDLLRKYPWPEGKGEPTPKLANFDKNVETTTPVGRYPEGATPEGLLDMAGNVWEWMNNYYDEKKGRFALRGGCWVSKASSLLCASRNNGIYHDYWVNLIGFRVLRPNPQ
ncbi:MAG: SUMF1/EgtB/PvdO family nonheme iron enzyme [Candidatus Aminicenantes bacterium]|nr:SUMF1/EgtB/PvdO family nonheme iron enzyme [Candidatus Aminicenantes bacterium]